MKPKERRTTWDQVYIQVLEQTTGLVRQQVDAQVSGAVMTQAWLPIRIPTMDQMRDEVDRP